ncbi:MAG: type II and III secretion system protein family protein [Novosphingobium sp.]|nr:type II and III secretion system protein family protein [Novosphingobium sp.]
MAIDIKTILTAALPLALSPVAAFPALAQYGGASALHGGTMEIPLNKSQVLTVDQPVARALIGGGGKDDAMVADVVPITSRSIYILGKNTGTTSLTLFDAGGRVISVIDISVGPDIAGLADKLRSLVPGEPIAVAMSNDSVVLSGTVGSAGAADRAAQIARSFAGDKVINLIGVGSSQQVMVEVRFAEVNRSAGKDLGMAFGGRSGTFAGQTGAGTSWSKDANTGNSILQLAEISNSFGIFQKAFTIGGMSVTGMLNAMENRGLAKTLAQPTLIALSGEKASFLAGGEFPVPVAQSGGGGTGGATPITVEFKPFGVSLAFTPTVLGDRTISMIVEPEVSAIDPTASLTVGNISIPGLKTRRASTTLELRDGESFAIAGLLQQDFKTTVNQLPLLGSIPILGTLFRSSNFQKGETELMIVVTPHLIAPLKPEQVHLPTDSLKDPNAADTMLLGQPYRPRPLEQKPAPAVPAPAPTPAQPAQDDTYAY